MGKLYHKGPLLFSHLRDNTLGRCGVQMGRLAAAESYFRAAIGIDPSRHNPQGGRLHRLRPSCSQKRTLPLVQGSTSLVRPARSLGTVHPARFLSAPLHGCRLLAALFSREKKLSQSQVPDALVICTEPIHRDDVAGPGVTESQEGTELAFARALVG